MEKEKKSGKKYKKILKWFDFSGESFTFKYKDENKLSSILAGIIFIFFYAIALFYFIYISFPFFRRELFSLQYYFTNLDGKGKEDIKLGTNLTAFAFGLTNDEKNPTYNITDLFIIEAEFTAKKNRTKIPNKTKPIEPKECLDEYFIEIRNNSFVWKDIEELKCFNPTDLEYSPEGIYTDEYFSYYTITVKAKYENNETHNNLIEDYLTRYDCKLQFYYTDIRLNLSNFSEPFSYTMNSMFLQLNPTLIQKKNIFYMNYHLYNDDGFIHLYMKNENPRIETGLSRVEDYAVYKGLNRTDKDDDVYSNYAKIYIRADDRKIIIKREYKDIMEFYADKSSLLLSIYWILCFFFSLYDREKANHSISKRLFYFEGIDNNKFKEFNELKEVFNFRKRRKINNENQEIKISPFKPENISTKEVVYNNFITGRDSKNKTFLRRDSKSTFNSETTEKDNKEKIKDKIVNEKSINYYSFSLIEIIRSKLHICKTKKFKKIETKVNLFEYAKKMIDDKLDIINYIKNMNLLEIINNIQFENNNMVNFLSKPIIYLNDIKNGKKHSENEINDDIETNYSIETIDMEEEEEDKRKIDEKMNMDPILVLKKFTEDETYTSSNKFNSGLSKEIFNLVKNRNKTKFEIGLLNYIKKQLKGIH